MSLHQYRKFVRVAPETVPVQVPKQRAVSVRPVRIKPLALVRMKKPRRYGRRSPLQLVPVALIVLGSIIMVNVLWPILSYQFFSTSSSTPVLAAKKSDPVAEQVVKGAMAIAQAEDAQPRTVILQQDLNYTNLSDWFPDHPIPEVRPEEAQTYLIDIPALGIEQAEVKEGGLNLDSNLIQYPRTANPGEFGAPVIFGHSTVPWFYNPSTSNPHRYTSIFTRLMNLIPGDRIVVRHKNIVYTYEVIGKTEVKPEDVSILDQDYGSHLLKLVTCVPPGTVLRRGVVTARLTQVQ